MIGVIANPDDYSAVSEFFELFKTPWEFYQGGRVYDVLLSTTGEIVSQSAAKLVFVYSGRKTAFDASQDIEIISEKRSTSVLSYKGKRIPVYGDSVTFRQGQVGTLADEESQRPAIQIGGDGGNVLVRVGYDLFDEITALLSAGQPVAHAGIPALDLHIALLRDTIVESGVALVEIPPVPDGYRFIACLTHDVDHPSVRAHKFDSTMLGFLWRAVFGSVVKVSRGRLSLRNLLTNWWAALKVFFVHLGVAKDFWRGFDDYMKLEEGLNSTYFVIPFKGRPGRTTVGFAPKARGAGYGAADIAGEIQKLTSAGSEIGLHGIDAWLDTPSGQAEMKEIRQLTGNREIGIRMHWLYFDNQESPMTLEKAGFEYDSTVGYNGTVGYRAGTTQVYKPLNVTRLLELPLHIMDTALFYPAHLDLSSKEARKRVDDIIDHAIQFGGTITVNWHDRSMAPERLWGGFYADMVGDLKNREAWFSSASHAVSWFRKRRAVVFEQGNWGSDGLRVKVSPDGESELPGLHLRIYNASGSHPTNTSVRDIALKESMDICVAQLNGGTAPESLPATILSEKP